MTGSSIIGSKASDQLFGIVLRLFLDRELLTLKILGQFVLVVEFVCKLLSKLLRVVLFGYGQSLQQIVVLIFVSFSFKSGNGLVYGPSIFFVLMKS